MRHEDEKSLGIKHKEEKVRDIEEEHKALMGPPADSGSFCEAVGGEGLVWGKGGGGQWCWSFGLTAE